MATINGLTAERMTEIIDASVESASISGTTLLFTRHDGSSFSAGDFNTFISDAVNTAVAAAVPPAVAGGYTYLGNLSGPILFPGQAPATMVNHMFAATLIGNVSLDGNNFPTPAVNGTQIILVLHQDGTGNRTLTTYRMKRSQGVFVLSANSWAVDIISCVYDGATWYIGAMGLNFL